MNKFNKELAPITGKAWDLITEEVKNVLSLQLAGRKVIDFVGPLSWETSAVKTGEVKSLATADKELTIKQRQVLPLLELKTAFKIARDDLDFIERGGMNPDWNSLIKAAFKIAKAEENIIFNGLNEAKIKGILKSAKLSVTLPNAEKYPEVIMNAVSQMNDCAIGGPFALVLGTKEYHNLAAATYKNGRPIIDQVAHLVDEIVKAPLLEGCFLISKRGGDFEFTSGQDFTIGYTAHDDKYVHLYLEESFTFRVITPEAAVIIK